MLLTELERIRRKLILYLHVYQQELYAYHWCCFLESLWTRTSICNFHSLLPYCDSSVRLSITFVTYLQKICMSARGQLKFESFIFMKNSFEREVLKIYLHQTYWVVWKVLSQILSFSFRATQHWHWKAVLYSPICQNDDQLIDGWTCGQAQFIVCSLTQEDSIAIEAELDFVWSCSCSFTFWNCVLLCTVYWWWLWILLSLAENKEWIIWCSICCHWQFWFVES